MKPIISSWIVRLSLTVALLSVLLAAYGPLLGAVATSWINATVAFLAGVIGLLRTFRANEPLSTSAARKVLPPSGEKKYPTTRTEERL